MNWNSRPAAAQENIVMTHCALAGAFVFAVIGLAQAPHPRIEATYRTPAARAASEDLTRKREIAIKAQVELDKLMVQQKESSAPIEPEIAAAKVKADAATTDAKAAAAVVFAEPDSQPVPPSQVKYVEESAAQIQYKAEIDGESSVRLNLGLTLLASLLALGAAVSGALRKSILASVLSLCAGTVSGMPKLLGFDQSPEFYQQLYSGAKSLASDVRFDLVVTNGDYNSYLRRLDVLNRYTGPNVTKSRQSASELMEALLAAKVPHKELPPAATPPAP